jgi:putative hydrolase of the HAD superfamily
LHPFRADKTLLIDDNLLALESAREYGIDHLLAISQPDSRAPPRVIDGFDAIHSFDQIMPVNEVPNEE